MVIWLVLVLGMVLGVVLVVILVMVPKWSPSDLCKHSFYEHRSAVLIILRVDLDKANCLITGIVFASVECRYHY